MLTFVNEYIENLKITLDAVDRAEILNFINLLEEARLAGKNIFIMGNGGSGSSASHFCCDFNKGISYQKLLEKRYKCICLNDNIPTMLAYANDISYDDVFVEQLKNFVSKDDLVIGISGSGNSKNVIKAIEYANCIGAKTLSLTGFSGGVLKQISKHCVYVPINNMQIAEDIHMMIFHLTVSVLFKTLAENKIELTV